MATTSCCGSCRARARALGGSSPRRVALAHRDLRRGAHGCRGRCDLRRGLPPCEPRAHQSAQRVSATALGYTGGHDRTWHRQAPPGHLLPGLAPRALSLARKVALTSCSPPARVLGVLEATPRAAHLGPWDHEAVEVPDLARWPTAWTPRSEPFAPVPWTAAPTRSSGRMRSWSRYERPVGPRTSTCSSSLESMR